MGRRSSRDAGDDDGHDDAGHRRREARDREATASYSLPRRPGIQVQRYGPGSASASSSKRSSSRSQARRPDGSRVTESAAMPPTPQAARSAAHAYRRTRERRVVDEEYSESPSSRSSRSSESTDHEGEDDHIEVIEDADDEAPRERRRVMPQRDPHRDSSESVREPGRSGRLWRESTSGDDDARHGRRYSAVEQSSSRRHVTAPREPRHSPHRSRHQKVTSVIEDSRPPVSSRRPSQRSYVTTEIVYEDERPRRSKTVSSSRSSVRSSSRRRSSFIGNVFNAGPARHTELEKPVKLVECVICLDEVPSAKAAKLKCGHRMCHKCLQRSFKLSIRDPQHMPPKCCTAEHIPLKHVDRLFDNSFKKTWNRKFAEFSTRNRIYCPSKKCGEWIRPSCIRREDGRKVARCGNCKTKVCPTCNNKWHRSEECPKDEDTNQFLQQAKDEGWQRCYRCKAMVELKEGCNHMTCRCGAQFCMICGVKWKNCDCPWFTYDSIEGDRLQHMNIPVPPIRGDLRDIFMGDGPPAPAELRGQAGGGPLPARHRPQTFEEERVLRQLQEEGDRELARRLQLHGDVEEHHMMGGVGDVVGIGNSAGHFMNENYRRTGLYTARPRNISPAYERGSDYVANANHARGVRGGSMERRLADRLSERRAGPDIQAGAGPRAPLVNPMGPPPPVLRRHTVEEETYNSASGTRRSERVVPGRVSRQYEDERAVHEPRSRRRRRREAEEEEATPRDSTMAGLNGEGRGMNRVFEWRNFVEPGVPDGEATTRTAAAPVTTGLD